MRGLDRPFGARRNAVSATRIRCRAIRSSRACFALPGRHLALEAEQSCRGAGGPARGFSPRWSRLRILLLRQRGGIRLRLQHFLLFFLFLRRRRLRLALQKLRGELRRLIVLLRGYLAVG